MSQASNLRQNQSHKLRQVNSSGYKVMSNGSESENRKRHSSIDKPLVDMPKRQSAVIGDCNYLLNEALINGSIKDEIPSSETTLQRSPDKRTSRGSLKRSTYGNKQHQYFSNHQLKQTRILGNGAIASFNQNDMDIG